MERWDQEQSTSLMAATQQSDSILRILRLLTRGPCKLIFRWRGRLPCLKYLLPLPRSRSRLFATLSDHRVRLPLSSRPKRYSGAILSLPGSRCATYSRRSHTGQKVDDLRWLRFTCTVTLYWVVIAFILSNSSVVTPRSQLIEHIVFLRCVAPL